MAKTSKALVVAKPRGLRTVEARMEVLPPKKGGSLVTKADADALTGRSGGQLSVPKKGGKTVIVAETTDETSRRKGSGEIRAMNTGGASLKGLVKAADAVRVAASFGATVGAVEEAMTPYVLSWANKRKRQKLADGGSIQRRSGGAGYGNDNNAGFAKVRGSESKVGKGKAGGQSSEAFAEQVRERWEKKPTPVEKGVTGKAAPAQLGGKAAPLALGDKAKATAKSAGALGFSVGGVDLGPASDKAAKAAGKTIEKRAAEAIFADAPGAAQSLAGKVPLLTMATDTLRDAKDLISRSTGQRGKTMKVAHKLKLADVKAALKGGRWKAALNLVLEDPALWESAAAQERAMQAVEKAAK